MNVCVAPKKSRSGYTHYGCRCAKCCGIKHARNARRYRLIAYGRWEGMVDAEPVRAHVLALRACGLGLIRISALSGVSNGCLVRLLYGDHGLGPTRRVRPETAQKILAVRATLDDLSDGAYVDATATHRQIQSLAAIGWSLSEQARRVGRRQKHYVTTLTRPRVTAKFARAVRDLFEELSMTPAPSGQVSSRTRRMAADRGWSPPLAWDDIDDLNAEPEDVDVDSSFVDEVAVERALAGADVALTDAELVAVLQAGVARGEPLSHLAARLGVNYEGAKKMLGGDLTPRREKQQRIEAEILRVGDRQGDYVIAASLGVARSTVTRARARLAERQLVAS